MTITKKDTKQNEIDWETFDSEVEKFYKTKNKAERKAFRDKLREKIKTKDKKIFR